MAEGIAGLNRESAGKAIPVPDIVVWFAEWARDTRAE